MNAETAYIGLGSNLPSIAGSPKTTLIAAVERLGSIGTVTAQSSFYETEPVGNTYQPRFLNAAVAIQTVLKPIEVLDQLLAIEREFGRDRSQTPAKGPRTLDLDLLLMGDCVLSDDRLTLPHPEMAMRRFVLGASGRDRVRRGSSDLGKTISALLNELRDEGQNRIEAVHIS